MVKLLKHFCIVIFQNDESLRFIGRELDFFKYAMAYR